MLLHPIAKQVKMLPCTKYQNSLKLQRKHFFRINCAPVVASSVFEVGASLVIKKLVTETPTPQSHPVADLAGMFEGKGARQGQAKKSRSESTSLSS